MPAQLTLVLVAMVLMCTWFISASSLHPPATFPFSSLKSAQQWVDSKNAVEVDFWNEIIEFDDLYGDIADPSCKFVFDKNTFNLYAAEAKANVLRKKIASYESISCEVVRIEDIPANRTIAVTCLEESTWFVPIVGSTTVSIASEQVMEFNEDGLLIRYVADSRNDMMGVIIRNVVAAVTPPPNARRGNAQGVDYNPTFQFGPVMMDKFDLILLGFLTFISVGVIIIVTVLCRIACSMQKDASNKYRKVKQFEETETEME